MVPSTVVLGLKPVFINNKFGRSVKVVEDCAPPPAEVSDLDWTARPYRDKELGSGFNVDTSENLLIFVCYPVVSSSSTSSESIFPACLKSFWAF